MDTAELGGYGIANRRSRRGWDMGRWKRAGKGQRSGKSVGGHDCGCGGEFRYSTTGPANIEKAETLVITTMFPTQSSPALLPSTISQPLDLLIATLQPTLNTIKRALSSHTFVALDLYQSLARVQSQWDNALRKCFAMAHAPTNSSQVNDMLTALNRPVSTLRGLVSRSFPEFLVDIRMAQDGHGSTSAISETTHSTLTYLETLPIYEKTIESLLSRSQSERSWLMGAKDPPSPARNAAEEGGIVNLYVCEYGSTSTTTHD